MLARSTTPDEKNSRLFKICAINVQSLKPKTLEVTHELDLFGYDIMIISETWLRPNCPNRLLVFPGYDLKRSDRKFSPKGHGGVAVLCRTGIQAKKIDVPASVSRESKLESLWHLFKWGRQEVVVGAVYRTPRSNGEALDADFTDLDAQYQHVLLHYPDRAVIIGGDLNCCMLSDPRSHAACRKLTDFISTYSLSQTVKSPTYATGSLLDVFNVNP